MEEDKATKEEQKIYSAFLSGLPYETTEDDIKSFFAAIGNVTYGFFVLGSKKTKN